MSIFIKYTAGLARSTPLQAERGRFMPPVSIERLPGSVLERFEGTSDEKLRAMLVWLSPLSTEDHRPSSVMVG